MSLPERSYVVNRKQRNFNLYRPTGNEQAQEALREILRELCRAEMPAVPDR